MKKQIQNARADFLKKFEVLNNAAVGVLLVRTREPYRAEDALRYWTFTQNAGKFKSWTCIAGWQEHLVDESKNPAPEQGTIDLMTAIKKVGGLDGSEAWDDGVYVVHYPHWVLKQHPQLIQALKIYARSFPDTEKQLVMIVPEGFILPPELQNDVSVLDFDLPRQGELSEVYDNVIADAGKGWSHLGEADKERLVSSGAGMTESEFETALARATVEAHNAKDKSCDVLNRVLLEAKTEVVKRSEVLEVMPVGSMDEVGGLDLAKKWISKRANCFTEDARKFGVDVPKGIMGIGPAGTGKSIFAKAIAGLLGQPLIRFDVGKVFGSLVGQSEERVRSALKQLDAMAPCVAFIDEVDKGGIDPRNSGGDSGTSQRVMGNILTHMQESEAPVFWVLTANRADALPSELMRKGRLDEVFAILPPNEDERRDILKIHLTKRNQNPDLLDDLDVAVEASEGFVGAELEAAVKEAVLDAYCEGTEVTGETIADHLRNMKPISVAFKEDFDKMHEWAKNNAAPASTPTGEKSHSKKKATATRTRRRIKPSEVN